ncbi:unnamed protein product [Hermetia illucens]|uniref:Uncharacterized protein n=2 Tax=Hermetia illucens TaxID=343691 RepID=A0A7R8UGD3_HERIL|nr:unnamed protein product [Hermetia illucens]
MRKSILVYLSCLVFATYSAKPPKWSKNYSVSGSIHFPKASIVQPFQAWFDSKNKRVRVDYNDGTVKKFEFVNATGSYYYSLIPDYHRDGITQICIGTRKPMRKASVLLPNARDFQYEQTKRIKGVKCDGFGSKEVNEFYEKKVTLWVGYNRKSGEKIPYPVQFDTTLYYKESGGLRDHFFIDYSDYKTSDIPEDVFQIFDPKDCYETLHTRHKKLSPFDELPDPSAAHHIDLEFERFTRKYNVLYKNSREKMLRKDIFRDNLRYINSINKANLGYKLAVNHFADRTPDEIGILNQSNFQRDYLDARKFPEKFENLDNDAIPESFDWREHNAVGPVRDQGDCGSCYAFAVVGAVEGAYFLKTGKLVNLSVQALMDCSWMQRNRGCLGGTARGSYRWITRYGGIPTEEDYGPYLGIEDICRPISASKLIPITGYVRLPSNDKRALKVAIFKRGPIAVTIDTSPRSFQFYESGIYNDPSCRSGNDEQSHAALAVGYGELDGKKYWLIKNSWSDYWGMKGYMLMDASGNTCGILNTATYPEM